MNGDVPTKKIFDFSLLRRILQFAHPYRKSLIASVSLALFLALIAPLRPYWIQLSIVQGLDGHSKGWFLDHPGAFLIEITILQIVFLLLETACKFYFSYLTATVGQNVVRDLRNTTFSKILRFKIRQFDRTPIGTLTTRTINDIESVNDIFSDGLIPVLADILSIIAVLSYMFYTNWALSLICLAPFPFLMLATYFFKEAVNRSFVKVRNAISNMNAFVQEHLSGIQVIQAFAAEKREEEQFRKINQQHRDANISAIFAYSVFFPFVELISALSLGLLVGWVSLRSGGMFAVPPDQLAGLVTSFVLCLSLLFRPLRMIADKFNVLQMGMIASERVFKVLDNPDEELNAAEDVTTKNIQGKIKFQDVSFAYEPGREVLKRINFQLLPGQTMAIVGSTGSGKTTIISLLNGLYETQQGEISIDDVPIQSMNKQRLRSQIAVVLQDTFLFSGSISDNITLFDSAVTQAEIEQAARLLGIHDFILSLPGGYGYQVMERGVGLSTGQRQLIAFIRALLFKPSILILDEATSSVDHESEDLIKQATEKMIAGRTSVIIAHRLSTIRKADIIVVLDRGEIVERGTHQELLQQKGYYFKLCETGFSSKGAGEV